LRTAKGCKRGFDRGAHKIALAACERLGGAEQTSCRDEADADYQVAKARAEQQRVASDPRR